jgi:hypothetical protein
VPLRGLPDRHSTRGGYLPAMNFLARSGADTRRQCDGECQPQHGASGHNTDHLHQLGLEMLPSVTLAPVDFERQRLADGLAGVGFQAECPAFFVWLGVVPYPLREASADDFLRGPKVACQCCYFPLAFPRYTLARKPPAFHRSMVDDSSAARAIKLPLGLQLKPL